MFGLYGLAIYLGVALISAGIVAMLAWFWTDHDKQDFIPCFRGFIGVIVVSVIIRAMERVVAQISGGTTM